jgi:hypothetical protein
MTGRAMEISRFTHPRMHGAQKVGTVLVYFFDCRGVVHQELYLLSFETSETAGSLCEARIVSNQLILHHNSVLSCTALSIKNFGAKNQSWSRNIPITYQILLVCDFFLFCTIKNHVKV